jgi:hypothetical protein
VKLIPKRNQVVGHVVDINATKSGIALPDTQMKGVTIFVQIESVGSDVKDYKEGDIVLPHHINHVFLRGGTFHRVIFKDEEILGVIEDVSLDQMTIDGKPAVQVMEARA